MHRFWLMPTCFSLLATFNAYALDTSKLIKVTKENNPQCVTFYNYQGDLYCSAAKETSKTAVDPKIKTYEKQTIVFDERPWQAAWGQKTNTIATVEYIPAGEDIEQWQELVTSQFIPGLQNQISPKEFAERMIEQLKSNGFNPVVKIIETTPNHVLFEFRILSPDNLKQDELQLITKGSDGLYILHYATKQTDMGEKNRAKWIQNLKKSKIK